MEAIACVDCAIWDLLGKVQGQSVCALLGGRPGRRLPIISIGGYYREGKTLADIGREMESYREAGMAGCKFKVGGLAPEADAARVAAARQAAGADFALAVDANRGVSVEDAIRFARLVEDLDLQGARAKPEPPPPRCRRTGPCPGAPGWGTGPPAPTPAPTAAAPRRRTDRT